MDELPEDEDAIAQAMEDALQSGKGQPYRTRSAHGPVQAGLNCRVWRTESMTVAVLSFVPFPDGMLTKNQFIVSYEDKDPKYWVLYEYKTYWWYFEGLEHPDVHKQRLEAFFKTLKNPPKRMREFNPY